MLAVVDREVLLREDEEQDLLVQPAGVDLLVDLLVDLEADLEAVQEAVREVDPEMDLEVRPEGAELENRLEAQAMRIRRKNICQR